jgi:hypothetical protein
MNQIEKVIKDGLDHVESVVNKEVSRQNDKISNLADRIDSVVASGGRLGVTSKAIDGDHSLYIKKELHNLIGQEYKTITSETPFVTKSVGVMSLGNNLTGTSQVSYIDNPIMRSYFDPHLYDLFRIIPTATGNVSFPRGNSPVGEGSFGAQTEGQPKAQVDYDLTMNNVSIPYVAGYAKVSRQMLQDLPFLQGYLSSSLMEDWNRAYNNRAMLTVTANATTGSTSATPVAERILDYIGQHLALGLGKPDIILTTHAVWLTVLKTLPTNGGYSVPGGVAIDQNGVIRIAGVPLVPHTQIPTGKIYVMNRAAFASAQASGLTVRSTETDQDDFIRNLVTYRCEARVELIAFQPTAAIYGSAS